MTNEDGNAVGTAESSVERRDSPFPDKMLARAKEMPMGGDGSPRLTGPDDGLSKAITNYNTPEQIDKIANQIANRPMFDDTGAPITYRQASPLVDLLAMPGPQKDAYLAFKAAANTLKVAEQQYKAAQVAYADAVRNLSNAVTQDPLPSSGDPTPG